MNYRKYYSFIVSALSLFAVTTAVIAEDSEKLRKAYENLLQKVTPERFEQMMDIAEHWAPDFYAQTEIKKEKAPFGLLYSVRPQDVIADPFFAGRDLRTNGSNLLAQQNKIRSKVPFFFKETLTHYFLAYPKYNAVDEGAMFGIGKHDHDAETAWLAIRKDGSRYGSIELIALNRHSMGEFYSPDPAIQARVRENYISAPPRAKFVDKFSDQPPQEHQDAWAKAPIQAKDFKIPVFVTTGKHALSICMTNVLKPETTCLYTCTKPGDETAINCSAASTNTPPHFKYSLVSYDKLNEELMSSTSKENADLIFDPSSKTKAGNPSKSDWAEISNRAGLPTTYVKGNNDKNPEANFDWDMRIDGEFYSKPHKALQFLLKDPKTKEPPKESEVSSVYLFNPFVSVDKMSMPSKASSACLTNKWEKEIKAAIDGSPAR